MGSSTMEYGEPTKSHPVKKSDLPSNRSHQVRCARLCVCVPVSVGACGGQGHGPTQLSQRQLGVSQTEGWKLLQEQEVLQPQEGFSCEKKIHSNFTSA